MTIVGRGPLDQLKAEGGFDLFGRRDEAGQVVLRSQSGRAYAFEVHPQEAVSRSGRGRRRLLLRPRCSGRELAADASGTGLEIGYVGKTGDMGRQDAEHEARGDFAGYGFDIVLILRIDEARAARRHQERPDRDLQSRV